MDLPSCINEISGKLREKASNDETVRDIVRRKGLEKASKDICLLLEGSRRWDKTLSLFKERGLYHADPDSFGFEFTIFKEGIAEVRVGFEPSHKARVDLNRMRVEYYDMSKNVKWVVKNLFEDLGAKCKTEVDSLICDISGLSDEDIVRIFPRFAAVVSMNVRLNEGGERWMRDPIAKQECFDKGLKDEELELCCVRTFLEEIHEGR